jgi:hypothetical protein
MYDALDSNPIKVIGNMLTTLSAALFVKQVPNIDKIVEYAI